MDKISIQELTDLISQQTGQTKKFSEQFLRELVSVIAEYLQTDGFVKVKGLGTFKVITVEERKSVDVATGNEIVLPAHNKVQFTPEDSVKQVVNEPFAHLETTVLDNPISADDMDSKKPSDKKSDENSKGGKSGNIWWWLFAFIICALLLLAYFTIPYWKPYISEKFEIEEHQQGVEQGDGLEAVQSEAKRIEREQAYADSILAIADSALISYQDSVSDAMVGSLETLPEDNNSVAENPVAENPSAENSVAEESVAEKSPFKIEDYTYKMAMNAPVRETVTVIDGSRLTMVAYRAYGHKAFWVYVYDANRDVLHRPGSVAKGMTLKIADLPAELVNPNSEEAINKALELAKKY